MKQLIVGNWKMNGSHAGLAAYVSSLKDGLASNLTGQLVICPPAPLLAPLADQLVKNALPVQLGAQNGDAVTQGAYTGGIAPLLLAELSCHYVIIGHSERRMAGMGQAEGDELLLAKLQAVLAAGLTPIFCVGEQAGEDAATILDRQLAILSGVDSVQVVVAYEPVWAIGSGHIPSIMEIESRLAHIQPHVPQSPLLYGGSVTPGNAESILAGAGVGGVLIGGASLKGTDLAAIAAKTCQASHRPL